jgi:hypothetical protein
MHSKRRHGSDDHGRAESQLSMKDARLQSSSGFFKVHGEMKTSQFLSSSIHVLFPVRPLFGVKRFYANRDGASMKELQAAFPSVSTPSTYKIGQRSPKANQEEHGSRGRLEGVGRGDGRSRADAALDGRKMTDGKRATILLEAFSNEHEVSRPLQGRTWLDQHHSSEDGGRRKYKGNGYQHDAQVPRPDGVNIIAPLQGMPGFYTGKPEYYECLAFLDDMYRSLCRIYEMDVLDEDILDRWVEDQCEMDKRTKVLLLGRDKSGHWKDQIEMSRVLGFPLET